MLKKNKVSSAGIWWIYYWMTDLIPAIIWNQRRKRFLKERIHPYSTDNSFLSIYKYNLRPDSIAIWKIFF